MAYRRSIRHKVFLFRPSFTLAQFLKGWAIINIFTIGVIGSCFGDTKVSIIGEMFWSLTNNFEDLSFKGVDIIDF